MKQNYHMAKKTENKKDLLKKMEINPVTVIVSRNNDVVLEDEKLKDKDDIKIISVISGG